MNRSVFYGVVVTALVSLAALVPTAAADGVTVSRFPVSFGFFNPCTNENVDFSGTAMTVADQTPDTHGLTFHSIDVSLKGVGATSGIAITSSSRSPSHCKAPRTPLTTAHSQRTTSCTHGSSPKGHETTSFSRSSSTRRSTLTANSSSSTTPSQRKLAYKRRGR